MGDLFGISLSDDEAECTRDRAGRGDKARTAALSKMGSSPKHLSSESDMEAPSEEQPLFERLDSTSVFLWFSNPSEFIVVRDSCDFTVSL